MHRSLWRTLGLLVVLLIAVAPTYGDQIAATSLLNRALIKLLHAPLCDPEWYVCSKSDSYYPPQQWLLNEGVLDKTLRQLQQASHLDPTTSKFREHLSEIYYATGDDEAASQLFHQLYDAAQLRGTVLREGNPPFHFLRSRVLESQGNLAAAIADTRVGLQTAEYRSTPEREKNELQRLSALYSKVSYTANLLPLQSEEAFAGAVYAACTADWEEAWNRAKEISSIALELNSQQQAIMFRLLALEARWSGADQPENQWLTRAGQVPWDQWNIGDPYLWLANALHAYDPYACDMGARTIHAWYSTQNLNSAQGFYLDGLTSLLRGDFVSAEHYLLAGYRRDSSHEGTVFALALVYEGMNDHETASRWYERAVELWPSTGSYHARLARMLHMLKRDEAARQHFNEALLLAPKSGEILVWAGYFYLDLDELERARTLFEAALAVNSDNRYARQGLDRILEEQ